MAFQNKQILGQFKEVTQTLKDLLKDKDQMMSDAKSNLNDEQLLEFTAMERMMKKHLKNNDFMSAMRLVQKMKLSHSETNNQKEK